MARLPFTISLIRFGGTSRSRASALMLTPSGLMNSSRRISPGGIGSRCFLAIAISSVIVDNLDVVRVSVLPAKADAPLVVDANAVLTLSAAAQRLEPIAGRDGQVLKRACSMQVQKLPPCLSLDRAKPGDEVVVEEPGGVAVCERSDHPRSILRIA